MKIIQDQRFWTSQTIAVENIGIVIGVVRRELGKIIVLDTSKWRLVKNNPVASNIVYDFKIARKMPNYFRDTAGHHESLLCQAQKIDDIADNYDIE